MKKSVKALLFSGLVFPGAGYFVLGCPLRGLLVVGLAAVSLIELVQAAIVQANFVMDRIMAGDVPMDVQSVERLVTTASAQSDTLLASIASYVLLACWVAGMLDGYRIGLRQDRQQAQEAPPENSVPPSHRAVPVAQAENAKSITVNESVMPLVRKALPEELPRLLQLYRDLNPKDPEADPQLAAAAWQAMLSNPSMQILVAAVDGVPVASATLLIVPNLTRGVRPYALIENVVTDPAWRKRGIATHLLRAAQQMAWDANCYKVMLMTSRKDEATLRFYRQAGFMDGDKTGFIVRPGQGAASRTTA